MSALNVTDKTDQELLDWMLTHRATSLRVSPNPESFYAHSCELLLWTLDRVFRIQASILYQKLITSYTRTTQEIAT